MPTMIMPISDLRKQTGDVIRRIRESGEVVYITQHGRPSVVLLDVEQYELMQAQLAERQASPMKAVALLQAWLDEGDATEHAETGEAVIAGLNESHSSDRQLFPAETKGVDW